MNITPAQRSALFASILCASLPSVFVAAQAQALPGGTYQRTCSQVHWSGTTLVAECRKADGKTTGTGLPDANKCHGDIGNNNGQLQCTYADGKQSPGSSPVPQGQPAPSQGYERPGYGNGQPGYGYGQPGYGNAQPGYGNAQPSGPGYGYGSQPGPSYGGPGYGPPANPNYPPSPGYAPSYPGYGYGR